MRRRENIHHTQTPGAAVRTLILLLSLSMLAPVASAQESARGSESRPQRMEVQAQRRGSEMSAAVRRAERATGGQVLNVESMRFEGRDIHRVKVLTPGGRVRVVVDDPADRRPPPGLGPLAPTRRDDTGNP